MGMNTILVNKKELVTSTFVLPTTGGLMWKMVTMGPNASGEKSLEIVDGKLASDNDDDLIQ